jgi:hypothetical protein
MYCLLAEMRAKQSAAAEVEEILRGLITVTAVGRVPSHTPFTSTGTTPAALWFTNSAKIVWLRCSSRAWA